MQLNSWMVATANILMIQGNARSHCAFGAHLYTCMASGESTEYAVATSHKQKCCCTKSCLRQNQSHCLFRQTNMIVTVILLLNSSINNFILSNLQFKHNTTKENYISKQSTIATFLNEPVDWMIQ